MTGTHKIMARAKSERDGVFDPSPRGFPHGAAVMFARRDPESRRRGYVPCSCGELFEGTAAEVAPLIDEHMAEARKSRDA